MLAWIGLRGSGVLAWIGLRGPGVLAWIGLRGSGVLAWIGLRGPGVLAWIGLRGSGVLAWIGLRGPGVLAWIGLRGSGVLAWIGLRGPGDDFHDFIARGFQTLSDLFNSMTSMSSQKRSTPESLICAISRKGSTKITILTENYKFLRFFLVMFCCSSHIKKCH